MKKVLLFICMFFPVLCMAQGHKGTTSDCAPMKGGKIVYTDNVDASGSSESELFKAINKWAAKSYGKDVFFSNVSSNKNKGLININSKIELLLNDKEKTTLKFKVRIKCKNEQYTAEVYNLEYLYDPMNEKKFKTYEAEDVIANNGKSNKIAVIKDPALFCNATFFFVENLFGDIFDASKGEAIE